MELLDRDEVLNDVLQMMAQRKSKEFHSAIDESEFAGDYNMDSLTIAELTMKLEDKYAVLINLDEVTIVNGVTTIGQFVDQIIANAEKTTAEDIERCRIRTVVKQAVAKATGKNTVDINEDETFEGLGLGSIDRAELIVDVEEKCQAHPKDHKTAVNLNRKDTTVRKLVEEIKATRDLNDIMGRLHDIKDRQTRDRNR